MDFLIEPWKVYIKLNNENYIIAANSDAFLSDTTDWIHIDSGHGDKYHHAQNHYFEKPVFTMNGAYNYKYIDGKVVECTAEEIAAQEKAQIVDRAPTTSEVLDVLLGASEVE